MKDSILIHEAHSRYIPSAPLKVLFTLNAFKDKYGTFPLETSIVKASGLSIASVQRAKKWLHDNEFIDWQRKSKRGFNSMLCYYEIKNKSYEAPPDWEKIKHYFMDAKKSKDFTADQWRFLCIMNTLRGWGFEYRVNLKPICRFLHMHIDTFKSMRDELIEINALTEMLEVASELIYNSSEIPA